MELKVGKTVQDSDNVTGNPFIEATGGTITTCGNYKIHTFTSPGTFCVSVQHFVQQIMKFLI
jgi:hypothetical protein